MSTPKIFISYARPDAVWARKFAVALKAHGADVWMDAERISAGERTKDKLERALKESEVMIMLITPESVKSPNLFFELGAAIAGDKLIVPIIARDMDPASVPPYLQLRQHLVRSTPKDTAKRLVEQLNLHAEAA